MPNQSIQLVTRGDDAASCRSANRAIREAFEHGILRNTSIMACCPQLDDAYQVLGGLEGLCFGLHVTLSAEWDKPRWRPVSNPERIPAVLEPDGTFPRTPGVLNDRQTPVEQMLEEVQAQLNRLREVGFEPSYVDTHMGASWLDGLAEGLENFADREGLIFVDDKVARLPKPAERKQDAQGHPDQPANLIGSLGQATPGLYVQVGHPCYNDAETQAITNPSHPPGFLARDRDGQRRLFLEQAVLDACDQFSVEPVRYDQVL